MYIITAWVAGLGRVEVERAYSLNAAKVAVKFWQRTDRRQGEPLMGGWSVTKV